MITKYIGSASDLLNTNNIALIYTSEILSKENISYYINGYSGFTSFIPIQKNTDGKFIHDVTTDFDFNNVIMYSDILEPVGFTNINQSVSTELYGINTLEVIFDFVYNEYETVIDIDIINYSAHISGIKSAHKSLFSSPDRSNLAIRKTPLIYLEDPKVSEFTNNINDILYNDSKLGRYSGSLITGFNQLTPHTFSTSITYAGTDTVGISQLRIFNDGSNNIIGLMLFSQSNNDSSDRINQSVIIGSKLITVTGSDEIECFGSNYVITKNKIYSLLPPLDSNDISEIDRSDWSFVINGLTQEISLYKDLGSSGILTYSEDLSNVLTNLSAVTLVNVELIIYTEDLLIYTDNSNSYILTSYLTSPYVVDNVVFDKTYIRLLTKDSFIDSNILYSIRFNEDTQSYQLMVTELSDVLKSNMISLNNSSTSSKLMSTTDTNFDMISKSRILSTSYEMTYVSDSSIITNYPTVTTYDGNLYNYSHNCSYTNLLGGSIQFNINIVLTSM